MAKADSQTTMMEHSKAKVELYGAYLSTYLNILGRVSRIQKILLFDLMCGEGQYKNEAQGSPLIAIDKIKDHYFANGKTCPNIEVWFNDNGMSKIENGTMKVERVKRLVETKFVPKQVNINYFSDDYKDIHSRAVAFAQNEPSSKSLFFIDPYGYKGITVNHIEETLRGGNNEVLVFLPASFMYRFADKATEAHFPGGKPLSDFLDALYGVGQAPNFDSAYDFIGKTRERFRSFFAAQNVFVDSFTLERDQRGVYCLFFFTSHEVGLHKMLEVKWKLDEQQGRGFTLQNGGASLFTPMEASNYPQILHEFISSNDILNNEEIRRFGLLQGFLPKHSNDVMKEWLKEGNLEVIAMDKKPIQAQTTYVSNKKRKVSYRFRST